MYVYTIVYILYIYIADELITAVIKIRLIPSVGTAVLFKLKKMYYIIYLSNFFM